MPGRVIAGVSRWRRSQSGSSPLLGPGRAEGLWGAGHCAWLASPATVGRTAPGEMGCALRAVWRLPWGAGAVRRTWGWEGSHRVRELIVDTAGDGGSRGGGMRQEV